MLEKQYEMRRSMIHLNSDVLVTIGTGVSGPIPGEHDLIQICIMVLGADLKPWKQSVPFYCSLIPKRRDNWSDKKATVSREEFLDACLQGVDPCVASETFDKWFTKLKLPYKKKLRPLAWNWPAIRPFLIDWLGPESFSQYFDFRYRDPMPYSIGLNDSADAHADRIPYPKHDLSYLAEICAVPHERKTEAMNIAVITAATWRALCYQVHNSNSHRVNIPDHREVEEDLRLLDW